MTFKIEFRKGLSVVEEGLITKTYAVSGSGHDDA